MTTLHLAQMNSRPTQPPTRLTKASLVEGVSALSVLDARLAAVADRFGPPPLWARRPGFATLVQIVLEQQISLASARATYARLGDRFGEVSAPRLATASEAEVRAAGVTRQKASYCVGLARLVEDGDLDLPGLGRLPDDAVRERLMAVRGVGKWTADIYLLMALRRPDVWPDGDLALVSAAYQVLRLRRRPDAERMRRLARRWRPWRAVAARLLWHHYLSTRRSGAT